MSNSDVHAALEYHEGTKHSLQSVQSDRHGLDWENQPRPFKLYTDLEPLPLPREQLESGLLALEAVAGSDSTQHEPRIPDLATLATVLHYAAGITKQLRYPGGLMPFRAAACTGALYHIELYVVCGELPDLEAGVYHFGVHDNALRRLRAGDFRAALIAATGGEPAMAAAPVTIICTSTYWRNSWKYQARAYRHCFWDDGTILANLLAVAAAHRLPARVVTGFVDEEVNRLIGVDSEHEAALTLVPLGHSTETPPPSPVVEPISFEELPLSRSEVDFPGIRAMHAASSLDTPEEVAAWRAAAGARPMANTPTEGLANAGGAMALQPLPAESLPNDAIEQVIQRRGSSRRFDSEPMALDALSTILMQTVRPVAADWLPSTHLGLTDPYLIANAVDGLESGTYAYNRERQALEPLQRGDFREVAAYLALTQSLAGNAAVNVYFLADLDSILDRLGNRGYRASQLDASITAGRIYLASYALGLGATGLTFFDDDVTRFFSPHARGKSVMFLIALGRPLRRTRA